MNKKLFHDYQSDLASLREGFELLDQSQDPAMKERVMKLLIEKCQSLSLNLDVLKSDLEQRMKHDLRSL
ncbi:MAG: hypothetical protein ACOYL6_11910 [Bacteriovoracaceae bacterium]